MSAQPGTAGYATKDNRAPEAPYISEECRASGAHNIFIFTQPFRAGLTFGIRASGPFRLIENRHTENPELIWV